MPLQKRYSQQYREALTHREANANRLPGEHAVWTVELPGYAFLARALSNTIIKQLFYGPHRKWVWRHWKADATRKTLGKTKPRTDEYPLQNHEDWLALYCLLNGYDRLELQKPDPDWRKMVQTGSILMAWRELHHVQTGWVAEQEHLSLREPITAALQASRETLEKRRRQQQAEREAKRFDAQVARFEKSTALKIMRQLAIKPQRSQEIARALELTDAVVRQQLSRISKDALVLDWLQDQGFQLDQPQRGLWRLDKKTTTP